MFPQIGDFTFSEDNERLKVVLPGSSKWVYFLIFTASMLIWISMVVIVLVFVIRDVLPNRERYTFVLTVMMLVWLVLWYYLGRFMWEKWQYYAADREILFINKDVLIIRRPVSILGITDAYDMQYVNPFYFSEKHSCPTFDYGSQRIYFAQDATEGDARNLLQYLNRRFFPNYDDDDDDF